MRSIFSTVLLAAASLCAMAAPQAPRGPLSKAEVLELVNGKVPGTVIASVVQRDGISFEPSEEMLNEFRKAGSDDAIIAAMRVSWHPECPMPLSDKDVLVLAEHLPDEKIVNMAQRCGVGFLPTDEYLQGLRSSGAKDELIDALRTAAAKPYSRDNLLQLLASREDAGQIGKGVQERGIDFDPTEEDLSKLRGAGAPESLLQAVRDAKRIKQPVKQVPNAPASILPSPTGVTANRGPKGARTTCPPAMSRIPVFAGPDNVNTVVAHLECGELVAILEKDSGRIGMDKVLVAGRTEGHVQDSYLNSSIAPSVTAPVPTYKPEPGYTRQALHDKIEGDVELWIVVDSQGNVTDAHEVSKPLGDGLDEKAIETVKTWKFKPAARNTVPTPVRVIIKVSFRLYH